MEANKSDVTPSEAKPQGLSKNLTPSERWAEQQNRTDAGEEPPGSNMPSLEEMKRRNPAWAAEVEAGLQKSIELGRKNQARKG
jgi:hypothetical protein